MASAISASTAAVPSTPSVVEISGRCLIVALDFSAVLLERRHQGNDVVEYARVVAAEGLELYGEPLVELHDRHRGNIT